MSDHQNENASRIAAYLENRLSPEEREAFKRLLSEDDELRVQYVDALMNRAGSGSGSGGTVMPEPEAEVMREPEPEAEVKQEPEEVREVAVHWTEPEAEVKQEPEEVHEVAEVTREPEPLVMEVVQPEVREEAAPVAEDTDWPGEEVPARRGFMGSGWFVGITLLLLIIAGVVMYILSKHQDLWDKTVAAMASDSNATKKGARVDSAATPVAAVSPVDPAGKSGGMGTVGDSLFANLYKPYARGDDPKELRRYYKDYRTANYSEVLAKGDSPALGVGQRAVLIRDYMRLYVGLSALATGDARNAVSELEAVVLRTKPGDILYETAQWYLALAWLKRNDVDPAEARSKVLELAQDLSHGYSRYREPAMKLIGALKS
jgi:hypothetical protein